MSKVKGCHGLACDRLVTLVAGDRNMAPGKRKAALLVLGNRVVGFLEGTSGVTTLAVIHPRRAGKLSTMLIFMAVGAKRKFDLEASLRSSQRVAGCALDGRMRRREWKASSRMIGDRKCGWTPALHGMAAFAAPAVWPRLELSIVRIRLVAVGALRVRHRRLEIPISVAVSAANILMLAEKRKAGLCVIEG